MLRILWTGRSAMMAQQEKLDSISNNLANIETAGYKRQDVSFKDLVQESLKREGYPTTEGNKFRMTGTGVRASGTIRDDSQGDLINTTLKTDFAIDGEGYFRVTRPDGSKAYTRDGNFVIDQNGRLLDKNGNSVDIKYNEGLTFNATTGVTDGNGNLLGIPANDKGPQFKSENFIVTEDGSLSVKNSNDEYKQIGKISTFLPVGQDSFASIGNNLFVPKNANVQINEINNVFVKQGYVEGSNVKAEQEMTDMILTQRAYEFGSKALKTADDMWGIANNLRGR